MLIHETLKYSNIFLTKLQIYDQKSEPPPTPPPALVRMRRIGKTRKLTQFHMNENKLGVDTQQSHKTFMVSIKSNDKCGPSSFTAADRLLLQVMSNF